MAHITARTGGVSEALSAALFLDAGYSVFNSLVPEVYDFIIVDKDEEGNNRFKTVQTKTMKVRRDRNNELVVKGTGNSGPYSKDDVDYILGIHLPTNTGFLIENAEQTEYWAKDIETARKKWKAISLSGGITQIPV